MFIKNRNNSICINADHITEFCIKEIDNKFYLYAMLSYHGQCEKLIYVSNLKQDVNDYLDYILNNWNSGPIFNLK